MLISHREEKSEENAYKSMCRYSNGGASIFQGVPTKLSLVLKGGRPAAVEWLPGAPAGSWLLSPLLPSSLAPDAKCLLKCSNFEIYFSVV